MTKIPEFETDEEMAAWFDSHDTADFRDDMEETAEKFDVIRTNFVTRLIDVRLRSDYFEAIQAVAERKGMPYQMLVQRWLLEKLSQEAPDLVT
jgi:predicted DNA binding CopG/RHH family protein